MLQPTLPTQIETTSLIKVNADIQTKCRIFGHWCVFFFLVALFTLTSIAIPTSTIEAGIQSHQFCNEYNVTADFLTTVCPSDGRIHSYYYISNLEKTNLFVFIEGQFDFYNRMGLETADLHINYTIDVWTVHQSDQDETFYLDSLVANNQQHLSSKCEQFKYQEGDDDDDDDDRRMLQGGNGQSPNGQNPNGQNPRPQNGTIPNNTNNVSTNTSTNVTTNNSTTNISNNTSTDPTSDTLDSADEQVYDPDRLLCGWDVILYEPLIEQSNLFVHVAMQYQPDTYIEMRGSMAASEYTNSLIAIRYVFLLTSIITGIIYYCNLRQLQKKFWVIEQVFVLIQSILLPFFNDPLYAATVLTPNRGTAVIGVLFFSNFISFLLLFWLVQYDRIVNENGKKESRTINLPKLVVIALLWITLVVAYIILTLAYFNNPTLNFDNVHNRAYKAFQIMSLILAFLILLYILRYLILFCRKYDSVLWRYKLIGLFNIFFILCLGLFLATGSFSLYNFQGTQVLICISILNLYVFYMQYLWTPSQVGLIEQKTMDEMSNQQSQMNNNAYDELEIDNIEIEANSQHQVIDEKLIEQPVMQ